MKAFAQPAIGVLNLEAQAVAAEHQPLYQHTEAAAVERGKLHLRGDRGARGEPYRTAAWWDRKGIDLLGDRLCGHYHSVNDQVQIRLIGKLVAERADPRT